MSSFFLRLKNDIADSAKSFKKTSALTITGLFLALQIVLASYGTIQVSTSLKISLSHLALLPTAMLFGPLPAAAQGALCDILGFLLKPTGPYFPGFTISALLTGFLYGCAFYRNWDPNLKTIILVRLIVIVAVNIILGTLWLSMLYGPSYWAALPVRTIKNLLQTPVDCILLTYFAKLIKQIFRNTVQ